MSTNRLHNALSPYLRQHADNPVQWQPWDAAALAQARREDKPILLSIGYAACHWCHVMARESFADADTAAQMNRDFVNIKVDREERPDLDRIYQAAHFVFSRRAGGWPLTMFLTPAGEPFFGGTYFPPAARHGLPAFADVLRRAAQVWREQRAAVAEQNTHVLALLRTLDDYTPAAGALSDAPLTAAAAAFEKLFDDDNGGLGEAPKFPHPVELAFCLQHALEYGNAALRDKTRLTLDKMAAGGLHDHLGGGFFRYCVDGVWHVPHFEKMLCDNALLLALYADAGAAFDDESYRRVADGTAHWVLTELAGDDGGGAFHASLDAESPGGEGAFYLWDESELTLALTADEHAAVLSHYGIAAGGARVEGKIHLVRRQTIAQTAAAIGADADATAALLQSGADKLRARRGERLPPAVDDKLLTAWNALMCQALARAARRGGNAAWHDAARAAFDAVWQTLRVDNRTRTARRGALISGEGFLDDCAFLLAAALELLRGRCDPPLLAAAETLADELCTYYGDDAGGFFFTARDGEALIRRPKASDDGATPSGNGVALQSLLLLSQLTGEARWHDAAVAGLTLFYDTMREQPTSSASLLTALQWHLSPPTMVYLTGDADECRRWQGALECRADPSLVTVCLPPDTAALPPPLQKTVPAQGALAHVCDDRACLPPVETLARLRQLLEK